MVVALADSFFFDVDPSGARSKVLAFLVVSFTPFLVVAPFIGPVIDRIRGGRRFVVLAVAAARIASRGSHARTRRRNTAASKTRTATGRSAPTLPPSLFYLRSFSRRRTASRSVSSFLQNAKRA